MYNGKRIVALIPARGGSKGIKGKNIVELCGKPLIEYSIDAAKRSKYIDDVVVSTDSEIIADVARRLGASVPFIRPAHLAEDNSRTIDVVLHAVDFFEHNNNYFDSIVLLQPTQPLREPDDIDNGIKLFYLKREDLVSVSMVENHPLLIRTVNENGMLDNLLDINSTCRRQDMAPYYYVNGSIYINKISMLTPDTSFNDNRLPYFINKACVDIDTVADLEYAEFLLKKQEIDG